MTEFKSDPISIQVEGKKVFSFLNNFNNFEKLMPEQVINWQSDVSSCSFTIKGMADLAMRISHTEEFSSLTFVSEGKSPFDFSLIFRISDSGSGNCEVVSILEAKLNPMLRMMASRPLQNFVNLLVSKLKEVSEEH